jgi:hypothetical protein
MGRAEPGKRRAAPILPRPVGANVATRRIREDCCVDVRKQGEAGVSFVVGPSPTPQRRTHGKSSPRQRTSQSRAQEAPDAQPDPTSQEVTHLNPPVLVIKPAFSPRRALRVLRHCGRGPSDLGQPVDQSISKSHERLIALVPAQPTGPHRHGGGLYLANAGRVRMMKE